MKTEKIVSLDNFRTKRHYNEKVIRKNSGALSLPSADRLWELLDRNISFSVWREQH